MEARSGGHARPEPPSFAAAACGAAAGAVLAVAAIPLLRRPAPPQQLPGLMTAQGLDAHGPFYFLVLLVALTFAGAFAGKLAGRVLVARPRRQPEVASIRWNPAELILLPFFLATHLALLEIFIQLAPLTCAAMAAGLTVAMRLIVRDANAFAFAPLALLAELRLTSGDHPWDAAAALAIAVLAPFAVRAARLPPRFLARATRLVMPVASVVYVYLLVAYPTPVLNLFEHGFGLVNASEMLRGKALYRDLLPQHGPLGDALIDWAGMRIGGATLGAALTARLAVALLSPLALYAIGLALTGSPELAFAAVVAAVSLFPTPVRALAESSPLLFLRAVPSLFALAMAAFALRLRSIRWLFPAGMLAAIAWLTSVEFGAYAFAAIAIAVVRVSSEARERLRALAFAAAGGVAIFVPAALVLAAKSLLLPYLHATFVEAPSFSAAYNLGFLDKADFAAAPWIYVGWLVTVIALAVVTIIPVRASVRRTGPFLVAMTWIALTGISLAERKHLYFATVLPIVFAAAAWQLARAGRRYVAIAFAAALFLAVQPLAHVLESMPNAVRDREELVRSDLTFYPLPRARGALMRKEDAARIDLVREVLDRELPDPHATFYSFTNVPVLYFLLDRRMPIRLPEVPMYESAAAQREVIDTLERDAGVKLALVSFPYWANSIDGVPNAMRAPLVRDYLLTHFEVASVDRGVVFLRRRSAR